MFVDLVAWHRAKEKELVNSEIQVRLRLRDLPFFQSFRDFIFPVGYPLMLQKKFWKLNYWLSDDFFPQMGEIYLPVLDFALKVPYSFTVVWTF